MPTFCRVFQTGQVASPSTTFRIPTDFFHCFKSNINFLIDKTIEKTLASESTVTH